VILHNLDLLLYLAPSAALAVVIAILARLHPVFFLFTLAGTICHELAHLLAGLAVGARPVAISIIPRRVAAAGGRVQWRLGSVSLTRLRWYNAAPAALAPLALIALPFIAAWWRTRGGDWHFVPVDIVIAFLLAPQFLSFWPSGADWRIAARSWPYPIVLIAVGAAWWYWHCRGASCFTL
jgi:hypothetical protein